MPGSAGPLLDCQAAQRTPFSFNSPTLHAQDSNSGSMMRLTGGKPDNCQLGSGGPAHMWRARLGRAPLIFDREAQNYARNYVLPPVCYRLFPFRSLVHSHKCRSLPHPNALSARWYPVRSSSAPPPLTGARTATRNERLLPGCPSKKPRHFFPLVSTPAQNPLR